MENLVSASSSQRSISKYLLVLMYQCPSCLVTLINRSEYCFSSMDGNMEKYVSMSSIAHGLTELWGHFQFVANLGPQTKFPVPQGLLDYNGKK